MSFTKGLFLGHLKVRSNTISHLRYCCIIDCRMNKNAVCLSELVSELVPKAALVAINHLKNSS